MQRKKKRSIIFELHSIPIKFRTYLSKRRSLCARTRKNLMTSKSPRVSNKRLYLVSYSIPLSLLVVLLLGLGVMVSPDLFGGVGSQKSYAIETSEESNNSMARIAPATSIAIGVSADTSDGYGNDVTGQVDTAPGAGTAYRSHKINITGSNILSYSLKISGPTNLTPSSGASTTISGAGGKTGSSMTGNTWGYAWGQDSEAVEEMTYNTMPTTGTGLTCDSPASYNVNCERKLVFGANFGVDANPGTYTAGVTLSLTATPAVVTYTLSYNANGGSNAPTAQTVDSADASKQFTISGKGSMVRANYSFLGWSTSSSATTADTTYNPGKTVTLTKDNRSLTLYAVWKADTMQGITSGFCKNNSNISTGTTFTLKDDRDGNTYNIVKLKDGQCWMQQNLKLGGSSAMSLTSSDTDLASGTSSWTLPASSDSSWSGSNTLAQIRVGKSGMTVNSSYPGDGKGWQSNYGNYYSWCAATAGSCSSATSDGAVAGGSICPKNWHLPTGNTNGEFYNVLNGLNFTTVQQSPYLFPAAGLINDSLGFIHPGTDGVYWSSTANDSTNAYDLLFGSSGFYPGTGIDGRCLGSSVRCVADY